MFGIEEAIRLKFLPCCASNFKNSSARLFSDMWKRIYSANAPLSESDQWLEFPAGFLLPRVSFTSMNLVSVAVAGAGAGDSVGLVDRRGFRVCRFGGGAGSDCCSVASSA